MNLSRSSAYRARVTFDVSERRFAMMAVAHINAFWACQVRWQAEGLRPGSPAKRATAAGSTCEPEARRTDFASQGRRMHVQPDVVVAYRA